MVKGFTKFHWGWGPVVTLLENTETPDDDLMFDSQKITPRRSTSQTECTWKLCPLLSPLSMKL